MFSGPSTSTPSSPSAAISAWTAASRRSYSARGKTTSVLTAAGLGVVIDCLLSQRHLAVGVLVGMHVGEPVRVVADGVVVPVMRRPALGPELRGPHHDRRDQRH